MVYTTALFSDAQLDIRSQSEDCAGFAADNAITGEAEGIATGFDMVATAIKSPTRNQRETSLVDATILKIFTMK